MIRSTVRRLNPFSRRKRARNAARGHRQDVPLAFDMFDQVRDIHELQAARKLAGIYHKGHRKGWDGKKVLAELLQKHDGIQIDDDKREAIQALFAVILWGELAAWKISAELAVQLEPMEAKLAATSQAHDEARHFYTMYDYLSELGEVPTSLGPATTRLLEDVVRTDDLVRKLVGMQMMVEPMALTLFQLMRKSEIEPVLSDLLPLYERDEARHVALGVLHLPKLLTDMSLPEAVGLWTWEFQEYWHQFDMLKEMEPHFTALGIPVREVIRIGRQKQIRANQMLMEELGYDLKIFDLFMRFFQAKAEWDFPEAGSDTRKRARAREALDAAMRGTGVIPTTLTEVAA